MDAMLQVAGIEEVGSFLGDLASFSRDKLKERLREAAGIVRDEARTESPSRRVRGAMTFTVNVGSLLDYSAVIYPRGKWAFLANFLEHGTKAHAIPNFHGHPGEVWMHPGSAAQHFLEDTVQATVDAVVELVGVPPALK